MSEPRKPDGFTNQVLTVIPRNVLDLARAHPLLEPLYLTDVGFFPRAQHHYRERSQGSEQNILIYCIQGKGFVETQSRRQVVRRNAVMLIPRGVGHVYGSLRDDDPWHIYWAHYAGLRSHLYNPGPAEDVHLTSVPFGKFAVFTQLFWSIFDVLDRGPTLANLIHSAHTFAYILSEMFFGHSAAPGLGSKGGNETHHVENTISYLQTRIHDNLTLDELVQWNNLSKGHLTQLFKEKTGYPPIRFFISLKMQQACRYLDLTDMNIKQIAATMGYADPYYFSRLFTRTIGMSPTEYRSIKKG